MQLKRQEGIGWGIGRIAVVAGSIRWKLQPKFLSYPVAGRIGCEQLDCISVG